MSLFEKKKLRYTVDFMLSPPPPLDFFLAKKGGDLAWDDTFLMIYMKNPLCQDGGDSAGPTPDLG